MFYTPLFILLWLRSTGNNLELEITRNSEEYYFIGGQSTSTLSSNSIHPPPSHPPLDPQVKKTQHVNLRDKNRDCMPSN